MSRDSRNYNEQQAAQTTVVYEINQMHKKIDKVLQTQQVMLCILKSLSYHQPQPTHPQNIPMSRMLGIQPSSSLLDSQLTYSFNQLTQELSSKIHSPIDDYIMQLYRNEKQQQHQPNEMDDFDQQMQQQDYEQSLIQDPYAYQSNNVGNQHYFDLKDYKDSKLILKNPSKIIEQLQSQFRNMNLNFSSCQCLYQYPQMRSQSFHQRITDRNNILFLALLENQQVIGAFTEVGFSSKNNLIPKDNPKCCLFNLTKRHFLYAIRTNKTHSCDKSYVLFGNWQFKIKVGQGLMHSDLGTRGDCFKKQRFGTNQKEINDTREWIFGDLKDNQVYGLKKYMICAFK